MLLLIVMALLGGALASPQRRDERTETAVKHFPWVARLGYQGENAGEPLQYGCSAALVSNRYVLTVALCVPAQKKPVSVRLGEYDAASNVDCSTVSGETVCAPPAVDVSIAEVVVHPEFESDPRKPAWLRHNIALVRLARQVALNDFVRPVNLPPPPRQAAANSSDDVTGSGDTAERLTAVGWGSAGEDGTSDQLPMRLPMREVPLDECSSSKSRRKGQYQARGAGQLCAASTTAPGSGVCRLFAGSTLIASTDSSEKGDNSSLARPELRGLEAYINDCEGDRPPAVFTRVAHYVPWILGTINEGK